jgi:hypothetical protein
MPVFEQQLRPWTNSFTSFSIMAWWSHEAGDEFNTVTEERERLQREPDKFLY